MNIKNIFTHFVFSLFIISCGGVDSGLKAKSNFRGTLPDAVEDDTNKTDVDSEPSDPMTEDQAGQPADDDLSMSEVPLSFDTIRTLILNDNCINCHIGKHSAFELHSLVQIYADDIMQRMTTKNLLKRMPPSKPPIAPELIDLFRAWIEIGTPEFEDNLVFPIDKKFLKEKN